MRQLQTYTHQKCCIKEAAAIIRLRLIHILQKIPKPNYMKNTYLLAALALGISVPALAQTHPQDVRRTHNYFERQAMLDSLKMREILNNNAPAELSMPGTSRFAYRGRDDKFYLSIGGYVRTTVSYDFGNPIDNPNEFTTSAIPTVKDPGSTGLVQFSAQQSHICLNFVALPGTEDQVGAFVGANFLNNYSPELQFAYLTYRGLEAGYNYSIFSDPNAGPPTIDYEGPNAMTAIQTPLVQYSHSFGKKNEWTVGGGMEMPMYSVTGNSQSSSVTQSVPDIPAFVRYSWAGGSSWVRLAGIIRNLQYRDDVLQKNYDKVGWGVQLSGSAALSPNLTAYYQGVYGRGIASHIQDLNGLGMDLLPSRDGKMEAVEAWGAYGGLQYTFSPKVFCSATYSHVRTYADRYRGGSTAWGDQYRYAQYAVANVFWQPTKLFQTGLEYIYGRRVNYSGAQGHDSRIQCMFQVNF